MAILPEPEADAEAAARRRPRDDMASPVDLPDAEPIGANPLRWTSGVIAVATLFLFLFNANALSDWAAELPPNAINARIVTAAEAWESLTDEIGLGAPRAWLHARWKGAEEAKFSE
ncbi:MAG TPA: hypothetical protein VNZ43_06685 [Sphingomonadaceae bacterium]|nr:hypothetical protein [Sphingomonadaceae bacterium]